MMMGAGLIRERRRLRLVLLVFLLRSCLGEEARLSIWESGVNEVPRCENSDVVCRQDLEREAMRSIKVRGGSTQKIDLAGLEAELGDDFSAALAQNVAEHARESERSCQYFYCGMSSSAEEEEEEEEKNTIVAVRNLSMGSLGPEDFRTEFAYPLDLIKISQEPLFSPDEAKEVLRKAREIDGVDNNVFPSGKYRLGGDWIKKMGPTREWFNALLKTKIYPNLAASFPQIITNTSTLRAHSVALLKYNASHPQTDTHIDNGILALTIAMSAKTDYSGGGTFFEHLGEDNVVDMDVGHATWRPGSVRHGGSRVVSGERFIIGAFFLLTDRVEHVRRLKNRGADLRAAGKIDDAIRHFHWALRINPECATCLKDLSEAHAFAGRLDEAESALRKALALLPRDSDALFNLGALLSTRGDHNAAIDAYTASAEVNSNDVELLYNLGVKFGERHDRTNEIEAYERALKVNPDFTKASLNLGAAFADIGDDLTAEKHWQAATHHQDTCLPALKNLAILYEQRASRSLQTLTSATTKEQAVSIALKIDTILDTAQSTIEGIMHFPSTQKNDYNEWSARLLRLLKTRGRVIALSDIDKAISHLLRASELDASDISIWLALKQAYSLTGQTEKANEAQRTIARLSDSSVA